ncbi:uncharacterized protein C20orf141 homolog [Erinaceus europaeus]|uniref:Uncharacterized protein C20orf141 homolog n=1 Tax=Erinaceus europaeus TaxID=9365 RepID=A0A1S3ASA3_ERIEU|nr:uncharacterized protein C20orf141 homolog [Erinaceus europaeus]
MTQLCSPRPKALAFPIPVRTEGLGDGEAPGRSVDPCASPWGPRPARILDSILGLGALGLTVQAVFFMTGPALLLLLLLISFLAFDLLHRPADPNLPQHVILTGGQSQGAGEGPGQQEALQPTVTITRQIQDALLLLLLGLGLLLGVHGLPLALLGLAFCLHPWV